MSGFDHILGNTLLVDIAGGQGHYLGAFRGKFPDVGDRLVVEDLPHVIEDIRDLDGSIERIGLDILRNGPSKVLYLPHAKQEIL